MTEARVEMLIEPDTAFKKQLLASAAATLTQCFQCGTCAVTCPISPDIQPFPRKELLWSQWGLKDRLLSDPDLWLCHQCNDCAKMCPREANPGDVMAVLRQKAIEYYSVPRFLARMVASPAWLPALLAAPAVLMALLIWALGGFAQARAHQDVVFDYFFGHYPIIAFFGGFTLLALMGAAAGLKRFWDDMNRRPLAVQAANRPAFVDSVIAAIRDVLAHGKFRQCEGTQRRFWGHLLIFYGFATMFVTTSLAALIYYLPSSWGPWARYPFFALHPVKILGNVGGLVCAGGLVIALIERLRRDKLAPRTSYQDGLFLAVLATTIVTGIVCQVYRLAGAAVPAYAWYFVHLTFVFFLLVYFPYSKFAHLLYRTVALVHCHQIGRRAALPSAADEPSDACERRAA